MSKMSMEEFAGKTVDSIHKIENIFKLKPYKMIMRLDLNLPHLKVLRFIAHYAEELTISKIGKALGISMAMMTRVLDKLEEHKLVIRERDKNDRRIIKVKLSAKGEKLAKECNDYHKQQIVDLLNNLSGKDRKVFVESMENIINIMSKYNK